VERAICQCFGELLQMDRVGIDDNFFEFGGHSLLVISLQEKLSRMLDQTISVVDVFENPTPRQLADRLAPSRESTLGVALQPVNSSSEDGVTCYQPQSL
jgi:hypothetical protein